MQTQTFAERIHAANRHLGTIEKDLTESEANTYAHAVLTAARRADEGDEAGAHERLDELREWVDRWVLVRLKGEDPVPCDPFKIGALCTWD